MTHVIDVKQAMDKGGKQLLDIIRKQIPYNQFLRCMFHFRLTPYDLLILKVWLDCGGDIDETIAMLRVDEEIELSVPGIHDFFQKLLIKVFHRINMKPQLDEHGNVVEPLMFINYDVYDIEESSFRVVATTINHAEYWYETTSPRARQKFHTVHVFQRDKQGVWKTSTSKFAKQYRESYKKMLELIDGGL